jgi:hypothetical protein
MQTLDVKGQKSPLLVLHKLEKARGAGQLTFESSELVVH